MGIQRRRLFRSGKNETSGVEDRSKKHFLTIVTRTCDRPVLLTENILSVIQQEDRDLEQIFIVDHERLGRCAADQSFVHHLDRIEGELVYILDDDCKLIEPGFVTELKEFYYGQGMPDVIMVRSSRPQLAPHMLPRVELWGKLKKLRVATTNCLCYVVRRDLWKKYIFTFGEHRSCPDWYFLEALRDAGLSFAWLDLVVAKTQQIGHGTRFEAVDDTWFERVVKDLAVLEEVAPGDWRLPLYRCSSIPRRLLREASVEEKKEEKAEKETKNDIHVSREMSPQKSQPREKVVREHSLRRTRKNK